MIRNKRLVLPNGITVEGPEDKLAPLFEIYSPIEEVQADEDIDDLSITELVVRIAPLVKAIINQLE